MTLDNFKTSILKIPRPLKRLLAIIIDVNLSLFAVWLSFYLRVGEFLPLWEKYNEHYPLPACLAAIFIFILIFNFFSLYKIIFRYSDSQVMISLSKAALIYAIIYSTIFTLIGIDGVPRTVGIIQPIIFFLLVSLSRFFIFYSLGNVYLKQFNLQKKNQALIYGAGSTGYQLARVLFKNSKINVVGFIDDDISLQGNKINNLAIYNPNDIDNLIAKKNIDEIIIALDQKDSHFYKKVVDKFRGKNLTFRTLPSYEDLIQININNIRDLSIDDILGRKTVVPDPALMQSEITNKVVLVSGAGGSIGSELCRQIYLQKPKKIILLDNTEFALYKISEELRKINAYNDINILTSLCSVTNKSSIEKLLKDTRPETIFHTAAYKHVHLVEENKIEGLYNNIFGTLILSQSAIIAGVKKFVLISTDKAVRPTSVMGASKRISEMILQALSTTQKATLFSVVRFGNVLDSSGSVVPLFRSQIKIGGPVTITDPNATRYFMTITEAAQLVIQAGAMTKTAPEEGYAAPIYLLEMGNPIKIYDLARLMIELSGLSVYDRESEKGDIKIEIIGLRPGEKLHEELLIGKVSSNSDHPKIKYADEFFIQWKKMRDKLLAIEKSILNNNEKIALQLIFKLVSQTNLK